MGLFDMVSGALGKGGQGGDNPLAQIALQLVSDPQRGGLQGLLQSLQKGGLGEQAASWVSTGANLPVSAEQIQGFLGHGQLQQFAKQLGLSENDIAGGLARFLPDVIDKLTPDGEVPQGDLLAQGLGLLKGKFFGG